MRKLIILIGALVLGSTTSLQVIACSDNSKYNDFIAHVNNNDTFFGYITSNQDKISQQLNNGLSFIQKPPQTGGKSIWDQFLEDHSVEMKKNNINKIDIVPFMAPYYPSSPSDPTISDIANRVWNDKSISWQKSIWNWLLDHKDKDGTKDPLEETGSKPLVPSTDSSKKFTTLPIVFIISKGKLLSAGQGWADLTNKELTFYPAFSNYIKSILLG